MNGFSEGEARHTERDTSRRRVMRTVASLGVVSATGIGGSTSVRAAGGDEYWRFETSNSVSLSPTVVDGVVFVASFDGDLYAVDAASGSERWHVEIGGPIGSAPAVVDGLVFVGSRDGTLYAVNAETGAERWRFGMGEPVENSSPTVFDGTVFIGNSDRNLYAVDAETGDERWHFETDNSIESSPTVVDGTVYIGSNDHNLYAVDAETGTKRWRVQTGRPVRSSPTVVDDTLFVGSDDRTLYALDVETGDERWRFETGGNGWIRSSPTVVDRTVFFGNNEGNIYALDAETGDEHWRFNAGGGVRSSPTAVDDTVIVGSIDGNLYAIDSTSGDERWHFSTEYQIHSSPVVVDGTVFIGSLDHNLYAVDAGVDGSSDGSRVMSGTLGHHDSWANETTALSPAAFNVTIVETNAPLEVGDELTVTVDVTNTGAKEGAEAVRMEIEEMYSTSRRISLAGNDSTIESFSKNTFLDDDGDYTVIVSSENERDSTPITITEQTSDESEPSVLESVIGDDDALLPDPLLYTLVGGGTLVTVAGLGRRALLRACASDSPDRETEVPTDRSLLEILVEGDEAVSEAETARTEQEFEAALDHYDSALTAYQMASPHLANETDEVRDDLESELAAIREKQHTVQAQLDARKTLREVLENAETSFQQGIAAHVRQELTVSRIRYRQARNNFDTALEQLDDAAHGLPQSGLTLAIGDHELGHETLVTLPGVDVDTADELAAAGLETVTDLQREPARDEPSSYTVGDPPAALAEIETISTELSNRLEALSWWYDDDEYTFVDRNAIERRRERAAVYFERSL